MSAADEELRGNGTINIVATWGKSPLCWVYILRAVYRTVPTLSVVHIHARGSVERGLARPRAVRGSGSGSGSWRQVDALVYRRAPVLWGWRCGSGATWKHGAAADSTQPVLGAARCSSPCDHLHLVAQLGKSSATEEYGDWQQEGGMLRPPPPCRFSLSSAS